MTHILSPGLGKFIAYGLIVSQLLPILLNQWAIGKTILVFFFDKFGSIGKIKFFNRTNFTNHLQINFAENF